MNLLFVCASNSVRSQMAEGWARHLGDGTINVRSAGIQPSMIHPLAIATMKAVGIDISGQTNNRLEDRILDWADWVITLSDTVKPYSAYFPESIEYDHWSIPNPDILVNDNLSHADAYAQVRDRLRQRIEKFLERLNKS